MDERESIIQDFGSPNVLFNILKRLKIDDNVNIADFTFVYRKLYDCLPTENVKQITIKDYLNSLDILRNITKMMDWENSRMSFRKTLECIKVFVLFYTNIRKHKINDNYKNNQDNKNKEINKWDYVIAEYEKINSCDNQVKSVIQINNLKDNNNQEIEKIIKLTKFLIYKGSNKLNKILKNKFLEYHSFYKAYVNISFFINECFSRYQLKFLLKKNYYQKKKKKKFFLFSSYY